MRAPRLRCVLVVACVVTLLVTGLVSPRAVLAQSRLVLFTPYPGVTSKPGDVVSFSIDVKNTSDTPCLVSLTVASSPEGWHSVIKGGGRQVHQVLVLPGESVPFTLETKVPLNVKPATYKLSVRASSGGNYASLPLEVKIDPQAPSATRFVVDYPVLRGPSEAEYEFRITLVNDSTEDQMYSLSANAPEGWQVTFKTSYQDKQIASISVKGNTTESITVNVKPPRQVKAGEYPIQVAATAAKTSARTELKVIIMGSYGVEVTTPSGRLNARAEAGRESPVTLLVKNVGSADLRDLTLSSSAPSNWAVTFEPDRIDVLPAGQSREVVAKIRPDSRAIAGDYLISISVSSPEAYDNAELRVTVHVSTLWGLVGAGIVLVVVLGVYKVFETYGRR